MEMDESCTVYDKRISTEINFRSYTDAIVAKLFLHHNIQPDKLDLVLATIRDPGFNPADLTFKCSSDIDKRVKEVRNQRTLQRYNRNGMGTTGTVPWTVVHLLFDRLREDRFGNDLLLRFPKLPMHGRYFYKGGGVYELPESPRDGHEDISILQTLSLVHRDWRKAAQTVLLSRIKISGTSRLLQFLNSSACGPWIVELKITFSMPEIAEGYLQLPRDLLSQVPTLRALSLFFPYDYSEDDEASVLHAVPPGLPLEALHIESRWSPILLERLYDIVSSLPYLTTLSVIGFLDLRDDDDYKLPHLLASKCPPPSLKRLLIKDWTREPLPLGAFGLPWPQHREALKGLSWLLQPRGGYVLQDLRFYASILLERFDEPTPCPELISLFLPSLANLRSLAYEVVFTPCLKAELRNCATKLVEQCDSLQHLFLMFPLTCAFNLRTLQSLHVRLDIVDWSSNDVIEFETCLRKKLRAGDLPCLKSIHLSNLGFYIHSELYANLMQSLQELSDNYGFLMFDYID